MELWFKKHYKWIALMVGVAILAQTYTFVLNDKGKQDKDVLPEVKDDVAIAADISNMTGVKTEDIFKLKQSGLTWNEVLEKLRKTGDDNRSDREQRSELLAGAGIEETISKLQKQGYSEEDILEAKMAAERLQFQLQDIAGNHAAKPEIPLPAAMTEEEKKGRTKETIRKLADQFDLSTAVYGMVVLREELSSLEAALDEYLLALQIGIRFELYFSDRKAYLKEKEEKSAGLTQDEIITASVVERVQLEEVQEDNRMMTEGRFTAHPEQQVSTSLQDSEKESLLPDVPQPGVHDVRPENPAEKIMQEIEALNPNRP